MTDAELKDWIRSFMKIDKLKRPTLRTAPANGNSAQCQALQKGGNMANNMEVNRVLQQLKLDVIDNDVSSQQARDAGQAAYDLIVELTGRKPSR